MGTIDFNVESFGMHMVVSMANSQTLLLTARA